MIFGENNMKIGIMGGTFNPIHLGHLVLSEYIRVEMDLDKVVFIPTGRPPHKDDKNIIDGFHRKKMVELSIKDNPYFVLSDIELKKSGISYTIDTINELKDIYKEDTLYMIIGADSLLNFESWKDPSELLKKVNLIVADRLLRKDKDIIDEIRTLNSKYNIDISYLDSPIIEISSTEVRDRIKEGKSIRYLVREDVNRYILENSLYK